MSRPRVDYGLWVTPTATGLQGWESEGIGLRAAMICMCDAWHTEVSSFSKQLVGWLSEVRMLAGIPAGRGNLRLRV